MKKVLVTAIIFSAFTAQAQSGYYVKGELGAGMVGKFSNEDYLGKKPGKATVLGVYVGKKLKNNFSADLSLHRFHDIEFNKNLAFDSGAAKVKQSISSNLVGVNVNYTLPVHDIVKPFVSAGLGIAQIKTGDYNYTSNTGKALYLEKENYNVAWSMGLGADVKTNTPFDISLGYKFYDLGKAKTSGKYIDGGKMYFDDPIKTRLKVHAVTVGVKYKF
jgi:opacity protein-like surface antigen